MREQTKREKLRILVHRLQWDGCTADSLDLPWDLWLALGHGDKMTHAELMQFPKTGFNPPKWSTDLEVAKTLIPEDFALAIDGRVVSISKGSETYSANSKSPAMGVVAAVLKRLHFHQYGEPPDEPYWLQYSVM